MIHAELFYIRSMFVALVFMLTTGLNIHGQHSDVLYNMGAVPQRSYINPAFQPESRWFIGMPGFSQVQFMTGNSGFSFEDVRLKTDSGFTFSMDNILKTMPSVNRLYSYFHYQPLAFGFRIFKKGYFTFDLMPKTQFSFYYPKDMIGLAWKGNASEDYLGKRISFDNMGIEFSQTIEFSAGYSHEIFKGFNLGVRGRLLSGILNIHTDKFLMGLTTDANTFNIKADADVKINFSVPDMLVDSALNLIVDDIDVNTAINDGFHYLKENRGYAFDIGFSYLINDRIFVSGSVNDIGYINWNGNPYNISAKGEFAFEGFDISEIITDEKKFEDIADEFLDSIVDIFLPDTTQNAYKQVLAPSINIAAGIYTTGNSSAAVVFRNHFYKGTWMPRFTLSYNQRLGRILSLSLSYGMERGSFSNIGVGFALKLGPLQYYIVTDNALAYAYPFDAQNVSVMTGINWIFGSKPKKKSVPAI